MRFQLHALVGDDVSACVVCNDQEVEGKMTIHCRQEYRLD